MSFPGRHNPPPGPGRNTGPSGPNRNNPPPNVNDGNPRGRSTSRSGFGFSMPNPGQGQGAPQVPQSPPQATAWPQPTVSYDPRRERPNDLQQWTHEQLIVFLRWAYAITENGQPRPNYNHEPDINNAINLSETIVSIP